MIAFFTLKGNYHRTVTFSRLVLTRVTQIYEMEAPRRLLGEIKRRFEVNDQVEFGNLLGQKEMGLKCMPNPPRHLDDDELDWVALKRPGFLNKEIYGLA